MNNTRMGIRNSRPHLPTINTDDSGFSAGANDGVMECVEKGLLGSATITVSTPASEEALSYGRSHPQVDSDFISTPFAAAPWRS